MQRIPSKICLVRPFWDSLWWWTGLWEQLLWSAHRTTFLCFQHCVAKPDFGCSLWYEWSLSSTTYICCESDRGPQTQLMLVPAHPRLSHEEPFDLPCQTPSLCPPRPQQGFLLPCYPLSEGDSCKPFQLCLDVFKPSLTALQVWEYFRGMIHKEQVAWGLSMSEQSPAGTEGWAEPISAQFPALELNHHSVEKIRRELGSHNVANLISPSRAWSHGSASHVQMCTFTPSLHWHNPLLPCGR